MSAHETTIYDNEVMPLYGGSRVALFGAAALEAEQTVHFWAQECPDESRATTQADTPLPGYGTDQLVAALTWTVDQRQQLAAGMRVTEALAKIQHRSWSAKPEIKNALAAQLLAETFESSASRNQALLVCVQAVTHHKAAS